MDTGLSVFNIQVSQMNTNGFPLSLSNSTAIPMRDPEFL